MRISYVLCALGLSTAFAGCRPDADDDPFQDVPQALTTEVDVGGDPVELEVTFSPPLTTEDALAAVEDEAEPALERLRDLDPAQFRRLAAEPLHLKLVPDAPAHEGAVGAQAQALYIQIGDCAYFFDGFSYKGYICKAGS